MTWRTATVVAMFACAALLIGWDVVVATNAVRGDTISEVTLAFARRYPVASVGVGLALGIVLGHLFWPQYP